MLHPSHPRELGHRRPEQPRVRESIDNVLIDDSAGINASLKEPDHPEYGVPKGTERYVINAEEDENPVDQAEAPVLLSEVDRVVLEPNPNVYINEAMNEDPVVLAVISNSDSLSINSLRAMEAHRGGKSILDRRRFYSAPCEASMAIDPDRSSREINPSLAGGDHTYDLHVGQEDMAGGVTQF